jgi:hypothetical protein
MKMKTLLVLIAVLALVVPGSALASGATSVPVAGAGTLHVGIVGNTTDTTFDVNTPTPVVPEAQPTIGDRSNWQSLYINVSACTRVIFGIVGADTGWHCVTESHGHPASPETASYTAIPVVGQVNLDLGLGKECPFVALGLIDSCGGIQPDGTYPPVDLSAYFGLIIGTVYSNVCTTVDNTPDFYRDNATTLGCSGTVSSTSGSSFMALGANPDPSKGGKSMPKDFQFKNYKRRAFVSHRHLRRP